MKYVRIISEHKIKVLTLGDCRRMVELDRKLMALSPGKEDFFKHRIEETKEIIFKLVMGEYNESEKSSAV